MNESKTHEPISIVRSSVAESVIALRGLSEEGANLIQGMVRGQSWVTVSDGRLIASPTKEPLPSPAEDPELAPYWQPNNKPVQMVLFKSLEGEGSAWPPFSPSISISHLCGHNYTPEYYAKQAELLENYGFECLRSRRGDDGRYREIWHLSSFWSAKGLLKQCLNDETDETKKLDTAVKFLCCYVSFGTLDVMVQRAGMIAD